ncbi:MAG: LLM class flavin-dependent oxidoreductase [Actinomycetota bacterium]|nr:LLM class flavin-dependent oxidoreductase [Actinomycetota bacterium]
MQLAVCIASKIDDIDYVVRAEQLGYTHAWLADSHMIWSDPYATLALVAARTSTIQVGTGVSVAATRPAPVTAASIATINAMAPGRTFLGIGTGNTAMRIMGHKPMPIAEFDEYLTVLGPLLRGEEADFRWRGRVSPVRHIMPDKGFVDFEHRIPMYVSGFGPKSLALAGKHGDGAVLSVPPRAGGMLRVWGMIEAGASEAGRDLDRSSYFTSSLTTIVVLEPGEARDSDRVKRLCGAFAMASMHYSYDQVRNYGKQPAAAGMPRWDAYVQKMEAIPAEVRHQYVHQGHNCWVMPDEEQFVSKELMEATCIIGTVEEIVDRLGVLGDEGLDQLMVLPPFDPRYEVLEQVAEEILPHL